MSINRLIQSIFSKAFGYFATFLILVSCASYDQFKKQADDFELPTMIVKADKAKTWAAVVGTMKRYEIEQQNMDSGVIKTKWMDNTLALNFTDSFGTTDKIKSAKFKLMINVSSAASNPKFPQTKVTIFKKQLVENDMFQGWREIDSDAITEKTLLYRIQRVVAMDTIIERLQRENESRQIRNFEDSNFNSETQKYSTPEQQLIPDIDKASAPLHKNSTEDENFPEI